MSTRASIPGTSPKAVSALTALMHPLAGLAAGIASTPTDHLPAVPECAYEPVSSHSIALSEEATKVDEAYDDGGGDDDDDEPKFCRLASHEVLSTSQASPAPLDMWVAREYRVRELWEKYGTRGEGVRVVVIDTGVNTGHPALRRVLAHDFTGWGTGRTAPGSSGRTGSAWPRGASCTASACSTTRGSAGASGSWPP